MKVPHDYIEAILRNEIVVNCVSRERKKYLKEVGAHKRLLEWNKWYIKCQTDNESELASILERLRDAGFCFAGAAGGWSSADIFIFLREQGYLDGKIVEIMWAGPGKAIKREI